MERSASLLFLLSATVFATVSGCVTAAPPKDNGVDADDDGYTTIDDCDDTTDAVFPGAPEACNGVDDDCDGATDETGAFGEGTFYADSDGDGHGTAVSTAIACAAPTGFATTSDDCDDANPLVYPGAPEHCNDADENCNDAIDEDPVDAAKWYADVDRDTYGAGAATVACDAPAGLVGTGDDCDDANALVSPGAEEHCDGVDEDCDGAGDDGSVDAPIGYADVDVDGYGDPGAPALACVVPAGFVADATDCDDASDSVYPGAVEWCDGVLQNCGGELDAGAEDSLPWYADTDADTFGDAASILAACEPPSGFVADATDCDDTTALASPVATEACDTIDNDCDGAIDESGATGEVTVYLDADLDGYGDAASTALACTAVAGYSAVSTDCDDTDASTHPDADEYCGGDDENCDGATDEDAAVDAPAWYGDADIDGYGGGTATFACVAPSGSVATATDCNDASASIHPAATETCNGTDTNCSGDETDAINTHQYYADADGDGYGDAGVATRDCSAPSGYVSNDDDCDDVELDVNPGETEVCDNGFDDDCDGTSNGCAPTAGYSTTPSYDAVTYNSGDSDFGLGVKVSLDYDHDGDSDLLMGNGVGSSSWKVWLIASPLAAGSTSFPASEYLVGDGSDYFGHRMGNAGDIDLDGFDDLIVGASGGDGAAYIWYGAMAAGDTFATADATLVGDTSCGFGSGYTGGAGDTNGDGLPEVVVSSDDGVLSLFDGVPSGTLTRADAATTFTSSTASDTTFGRVVAAPGDTDGDGYDDMFVGTRYGGSGDGAVYLLNGPFASAVDGATEYSARWVPAVGTNTGSAFDAADVTEDGEIDLLVHADTDGVSNSDRISLFEGPLVGEISSSDAVSSAATYSTATASGDVDGDGTSDFVIGHTTLYADYVGGWSLFFGGTTRTSGAYALSRTSGDGSSLTPGHIPILADVNDDGFDDVVTGVQSNDSGSYVFFYHDAALAVVFGGGY